MPRLARCELIGNLVEALLSRKPRVIFMPMPQLEPELLAGLAALTLISLVLCAELFRRLVNLSK